jgi:hypothetical protein
MRFSAIAAIVSLLSAPVHPVRAQSAADTTALSAQRAVQRFYDWYVPAAERTKNAPVGALALRQRAPFFDPALRQAVARDTLAQTKAVGEIDGLDFDPFLASQDPCARYTAGKVTKQGSTYSVEMRGNCSRDRTPDALVEVTRPSGSWMISNVRYPRDKSDLRTILKELDAGRPK